MISGVILIILALCLFLTSIMEIIKAINNKDWNSAKKNIFNILIVGGIFFLFLKFFAEMGMTEGQLLLIIILSPLIMFLLKNLLIYPFKEFMWNVKEYGIFSTIMDHMAYRLKENLLPTIYAMIIFIIVEAGYIMWRWAINEGLFHNLG